MLTLLKPFRISKQLSFSIKPFAIYAMNVFTLKLNGVTGKCDWEEQHEDYDFHQEIARSSFADMLHDTERNQKYEAALKVAIDTVHSLGKKALVLDIGTGTGLLSMMAVRNGADCVTACEAFKPMSVCALDVIKANGMEGEQLLFILFLSIPYRPSLKCVYNVFLIDLSYMKTRQLNQNGFIQLLIFKLDFKSQFVQNF